MAEMEQLDLVIYTKDWCLSCWRAKRLFQRKGYAFAIVDTTSDDELRAQLARTTGGRTVPQVFVDRRLLGSFEDIMALDRSGDLDRLVRGEM
jgi:glutaredoxin 3